MKRIILKYNMRKPQKSWTRSEIKLLKSVDNTANKGKQFENIAKILGRSKASVLWKYYNIDGHKLKNTTSNHNIDTTSNNILKFKIKNIRIENDYLIIKY